MVLRASAWGLGIVTRKHLRQKAGGKSRSPLLVITIIGKAEHITLP